MILLLLLCVASGIVVSSAHDKPYYKTEEADILFEEFINTYGKTYSDVEKQERHLIFMENLKIINEQNSHNGAVFAINQFSDMNEEEFTRKQTGIKPSGSVQDRYKSLRFCNIVYDDDITTADAPDAWDWRKEGAVTAVKQQSDCGSCWAFGTIGTIESQYYIKNKELVRFSEQALVDCSKHNNNCDGGEMTTALLDLIDNGGVTMEETYPYANGLQECQINCSKAQEVKGCTHYKIRNEVKFKEVIFKTGPITTTINGLAVQQYKGGILRLTQCKGDLELMNHAVLLVGYGIEYGVDYWIFKNSWGTRWGEEGFFRIHRGDNTCGFMNDLMNCSAEM